MKIIDSNQSFSKKIFSRRLSILLTTLFVFSGLLKWIDIWVIDATVLFGSLAILSALFSYMLTPNPLIKVFELNNAFYLILFSFWFYLSMTYSTSPSYVYVKATNYILIILSFLLPLLTIETKEDIKFYLVSFGISGIAVASVIIYLYIEGGYDLYPTYFIYTLDNSRFKVPDYLALGSPVGLSVLIFAYLKKSKISFLLSFTSIIALILLSGRGVVIGLGLSLFIIYIRRFKMTETGLRNIFFTILLIVFTVNFLPNWKGSEVLLSRMENITQGDKSLLSRYEQYKFVVNTFFENPILGIGLGSFGVEFFNTDIRAYPHNLILEVLVEQGLIGLILFLSFLLPILYSSLRLLYYNDPIFYILVGLLIFEFFNALKSSSIVEHRLLFLLLGLCFASKSRFKNP